MQYEILDSCGLLFWKRHWLNYKDRMPKKKKKKKTEYWGNRDENSLSCLAYSKLNYECIPCGYFKLFKESLVQETYVVSFTTAMLLTVQTLINILQWSLERCDCRFKFFSWKGGKLICLTYYCAYTHRLKIKNSAFFPHTVYLYSVWFLQQTTITFLHRIHRLVFLMVVRCFLCDVRN
jgi:hypothetical protein